MVFDPTGKYNKKRKNKMIMEKTAGGGVMPRLSNKAWPWYAVFDGRGWVVQRWERDDETLPFGQEHGKAIECAAELNILDYGVDKTAEVDLLKTSPKFNFKR